MAIVSLADLGAANDKTAGTSIALTTAATAAAGKLVVVCVSKDNLGTGDADNVEVTSISDSAGGNTWTKAAEFTNGQGFANAGITVSVWFSRLTNQITSGGTITANFSSSVTASAITAWSFTVGGAIAVSGSPVTAAPDGSPSGASITLSGLAGSTEYLCIRAEAQEGGPPATVGWTAATASWTRFTPTSTPSGTTASNAAIDAEFRIQTATSFTSDPAAVGAANTDNASVIVALKEASATAYTLTAAQGSFALSGQDAGVTVGKRMDATFRIYALTGNNARLHTPDFADKGSFAINGQATLFHLALRSPQAQGSFAVSGQTARVGWGRSLICATGSFGINGQAAVFKIAISPTSGFGPFALSGQAVLFHLAWRFTAAQGSLALSGQPAALKQALRFACAAGNFSVNGQTMTPRVGHNLVSAVATFTLSGQNVVLRSDRRFTAAQGSVALNGQIAILKKAVKAAAAQGAFAVAGQNANFSIFVAPSLVSTTPYSHSSSISWTPFTALDLSAGDIAFFLATRQSSAGLPFIVGPSSTGWSLLSVQTDGFFHSTALYYKENPTASETLEVSSSSTAATWQGVLMLVSNADTIQAANTTTLDPPNLDLGRSYGRLNAAFTTNRTATTITAGPAGYGGFTDLNGLSPQIAYATLTNHAQAEDPSAFTGGGTGRTSWTISTYSGSVGNNMAAAVGTFILASPTSIGGIASLHISSAQGGFALTGQTIQMRIARKVTAQTGNFTVNGQAALFHKTLSMLAAQASISVAGQAALLHFVGKLTADFNPFALTGFAAGMSTGRAPLTASRGTFTLTGQTTTGQYRGVLPANVGILSINGQAAILRSVRKMAADNAAFAITGQALFKRIIRSSAFGSFALNGQIVIVKKALRMTAGRGTFTFIGGTNRAWLLEPTPLARTTYSLAQLRTSISVTQNRTTYSLTQNRYTMSLAQPRT